MTDPRHGGRGGFGTDDMEREYDDAPTARSNVSEPARVATRRGDAFEPVMDLSAKIRAFIDGWHDPAHPFVRAKTADQILAKANRPTTSNPGH